MARPLRILYPGAFYHVFSRGNERRDVFKSDDDRLLFLAALGESCERFEVAVHSYCLMNNHIHLLLETRSANLSNFMKRLLGVYTIRFNRLHKRVGHLFQGRYKACLVERDAYLLELSRYIHLNPVRAGMISAPEKYPWSSMSAFLSTRAPRWLERSFILNQFKNTKSYHQFVLEGLKVVRDPFKNLIGGAILGSQEFADQFAAQAKQDGIPGKRDFLKLPAGTIREITELDSQDFQIYGLWRFAKLTQKEIGKLLGKTDSAISHSIRRFSAKLPKIVTIRKRAQELDRAVSCFKN